MAKFLALFFAIGLLCLVVLARGQTTTNTKPMNGHSFDEIVVSSHLNVRRKSKENRQQPNKLLKNVPSSSSFFSTASATTSNFDKNAQTGNPSSRDYSKIRQRRQISQINQKNKLLDLAEVAENFPNLQKLPNSILE